MTGDWNQNIEDDLEAQETRCATYDLRDWIMLALPEDAQARQAADLVGQATKAERPS
jgi:hypothetical protein